MLTHWSCSMDSAAVDGVMEIIGCESVLAAMSVAIGVDVGSITGMAGLAAILRGGGP